MGNKSNGQKRQKRLANVAKLGSEQLNAAGRWKSVRDMASARQVKSRTSWQGIGAPSAFPRISLVDGAGELKHPKRHRHGLLTCPTVWASSARGTYRRAP